MKYTLQITRDDDHVLRKWEMTADEVIDFLTDEPEMIRNTSIGFEPNTPEISGPVEMTADLKNITEVLNEATKNINNSVKPTYAPPPSTDMETARDNLTIKEGKTKKEGQKECGHCGKFGHNRRTCPVLKGESLKTPEVVNYTGDVEWYQQDILDMIRDGVPEREIYKTVITSITDEQYENALEWAKSQL